MRYQFARERPLSSDRLASKLMPSDVSENTLCITPVSVSVGGNCLPRSGSVLAFGHENFADEIWERLVIAMMLNEDYYLNGPFLRQACREITNKLCHVQRPVRPISYAKYSDQYDQ